MRNTLPFELAEPRAERHVESIEHHLAERVGIVAVGHHDGGQRHCCIPRGFGAEDLEAPRARPRAASHRAMPRMPREHIGRGPPPRSIRDRLAQPVKQIGRRRVREDSRRRCRASIGSQSQ